MRAVAIIAATLTVCTCLLIGGVTIYLGPTRVYGKLMRLLYPPAPPTYAESCFSDEPGFFGLYSTPYPIEGRLMAERYTANGKHYAQPGGWDSDVKVYEVNGEWLLCWRGYSRKFGYAPKGAQADGDRLRVTLCMGVDSEASYWLVAGESGELAFE